MTAPPSQARPLLLDIGCARGRWLLELAALVRGAVRPFRAAVCWHSYGARENDSAARVQAPPYNLVGVELYAPLVEAGTALSDYNSNAVQW